MYQVQGNISTVLFLYKLIIGKGVQDTFPNVAIVLRMFLVLTATNCSAERCFSKLKQTENCLQTSITHIFYHPASNFQHHCQDCNASTGWLDTTFSCLQCQLQGVTLSTTYHLSPLTHSHFVGYNFWLP